MKLYGITAPNAPFRVHVKDSPSRPYKVAVGLSGGFSVPIADVDAGKEAVIILPMKPPVEVPITLDGARLDLTKFYEKTESAKPAKKTTSKTTAKKETKAETQDGGDPEEPIKLDPPTPITPTGPPNSVTPAGDGVSDTE